MKTTKRACFILPTLHAGGIEKYTLRFLNYVKNRVEVTLICLHRERGDLHDEFEKLGIEILYKKMGYLNPFALRDLYAFFKKSDFDTVVDFTGNFGGVRMMIAKLAGINARIVFYRRSNDGFEPDLFKNLYNKFENRMVYRYATKILSNSTYAFHFFFPNEFQHDTRFKVIPNGVDTSLFYRTANTDTLRIRFGIPLNSFVIGHVGRFDPAKNHLTIFKVAREMLTRFENTIFVFCGKGTDSQWFKNIVNLVGSPDRVILLGLQKDVNAVLNVLDVFYFPSIAEGQPNALIEAMMAGIPIVASNIEPIKEVIPKEAHAHLVSPLRVNDALEALIQVKDEPEKVERKFTKWASDQFNQERNFRLFENEI